jgi:lysophospholipase L1-like esterase
MDPITYLALGDSLTEGVGADGPDSHFVAQHFQELKCSRGCRLINMGISGLTSDELYQLVVTPAIRKLIPRVSHITITTGGCDFIDWFESGASIPGLITTMKKVRKQINQIFQSVRELNPVAKVQVLGLYLPLPAYELGFSLACRTVKKMNKGYEQLCSKYRFQMIDPFSAFLHRQEYFADEVHPNQLGYDVLARLFHGETHPPGKSGDRVHLADLVR